MLPDSKNILVLDGPPEFLKDMKEMLDIMVHSPIALKILNFTVVNEPWMEGRKQLSDESEIIQKEWPTFFKRIMDGTFNTDIIRYGQNIHPLNLIDHISPQLANHFREIGVIPQKAQPVSQNSGR